MKVSSLTSLTVISMLAGSSIAVLMACKPNEPAIVGSVSESMTDDQRYPEIVSTVPNNQGSSYNINAGKVSDVGKVNVAVVDNSTSVSPAVSPVQVDRHAQMVASRVIESIAMSQARFAANSRDKCPKLLSPNIDSADIVRSKEVLKSNYCDYYIYPLKGDYINVNSNPDTVKAHLVFPIDYDFDNGRYLVPESDKYVIRLSYDGIEYQNRPIDYTVIVTID